MTEGQLLRQRVLQAISEAANDCGADRIAVDHHLRDDLGIDHCGRLILVCNVEDDTGVEFSDAEVEQLTRRDVTVQDVLHAVERHLPSKANA